MPTLKLTDKAVTSAKAPAGQRVELWDSHTKGLCLRVSANTKVWVVRYRAEGKQRRFLLGDADTLALADARLEAAKVIRGAKRSGSDPAGERKRQKDERKSQTIRTFNGLADAYLEACRKGEWKPRGKAQSARTIRDAEDCLNRYIRPEIGDLALSEIGRRTIILLLRGLVAKGIVAQSNKSLAVVRQIYAFAIAEWEGKLVAVNPATGIPREKENPSDRTLSDAELKAFWRALQDPSNLRLPSKIDGEPGKRVYLSRQIAILLELAMLLLNRRVELAGMTFSELDLDQATWTVASERMKNRSPHLVPLPPRALSLLKEAVDLASNRLTEKAAEVPNDFPVFASPHDLTKPIREGTVSHAMAPVIAALGMDPASPHDLRRTGSTALTSERVGVSPFIRSLILSHSSDTGGGAAVSSRHYDSNRYVKEKRAALTAWEGLLLEIVGERERTSNIRQLRS